MISFAENIETVDATTREVLILAAERGPAESSRLYRSLVQLGCRVRTGSSAEEVLLMIRREIFQRAVVAVELAWEGQPILARLARLPSLWDIVAIGPSGDFEMERLGRASGVHLYLERPVTMEKLAKALWIPAFSRCAAVPRQRLT